MAIPTRQIMTDAQSSVLMLVRQSSAGIGMGCTTAQVASRMGRQPGRDSDRKHSAWVHGILCELEALRHVRRLDDGSPIVWTANFPA